MLVLMCIKHQNNNCLFNQFKRELESFEKHSSNHISIAWTCMWSLWVKPVRLKWVANIPSFCLIYEMPVSNFIFLVIVFHEAWKSPWINFEFWIFVRFFLIHISSNPITDGLNAIAENCYSESFLNFLWDYCKHLSLMF